MASQVQESDDIFDDYAQDDVMDSKYVINEHVSHNIDSGFIEENSISVHHMKSKPHPPNINGPKMPKDR